MAPTKAETITMNPMFQILSGSSPSCCALRLVNQIPVMKASARSNPYVWIVTGPMSRILGYMNISTPGISREKA